ncbi:MAG: hypothetical protein ACLS9A_09785 [Clostridia bacterium]
MNLTNVKRKSENKNILTDTGKQNNSVIIDFKFLYKCNISCFNSLSKFDKKNKDRKIFDDLQHFLYDASSCKNIEELIKQYGSKSGSKIDKSNGYVKRIINKFKDAYPDKVGLLSDGLLHIHTKRKGNGKFVIFGATLGNIFYVLAFDPDHEFDKKK